MKFSYHFCLFSSLLGTLFLHFLYLILTYYNKRDVFTLYNLSI